MGSKAISKSGMVIAGRAARPCDVCGKERARWYCAADEAYLCERCDGSVHSANAVAGRHERVKLGPNGAPMKINRRSAIRTSESPNRKRDENLGHFIIGKRWHHRSRKRTQITYPRSMGTLHASLLPEAATAHVESDARILNPKNEPAYSPPSPMLQFGGRHSPPDLGLGIVKSEPGSPPATDDQSLNKLFPSTSHPKNEDSELAHEVPILGPFLQELISVSSENLMEQILPTTPSFSDDVTCFADQEVDLKYHVDHVLQSATALTEMEGDVNDLIEDGSISIDEVSGVDEFDLMDLCTSNNLENESCEFDIPTMELWPKGEELCMFGPNPFKAKGERHFELENVKPEQEMDNITALSLSVQEGENKIEKKTFRKTLSLRLNYEDVLSAWSDRGPLWMDGRRPQTVPDDSILDMSSLDIGLVPDMSSQAEEQAGQVPVIERSDVEAAREARVMRYREKRRTRLFSKKIRYEVRKLNAERRPRMKGRFIKRSSSTANLQMEE